MKVLVMEDDPSVAEATVGLLEGHEVEWVDCALDAVRALLSEDYDLAIFDHEVPMAPGCFPTGVGLYLAMAFQDDLRVIVRSGRNLARECAKASIEFRLKGRDTLAV